MNPSALHNDNTSPEAKQHAREQLKALGYEANVSDEHEKDPAHVAAGLKGCVKAVQGLSDRPELTVHFQCNSQP